jgi:hypothetical protein
MEVPIHPSVRWSRVKEHPAIVSGPSSIESQVQLFDASRRLSGAGVAQGCRSVNREDDCYGSGKCGTWMRRANTYEEPDASRLAVLSRGDRAVLASRNSLNWGQSPLHCMAVATPTPYRHAPTWITVLKLRRQLSMFPVVCNCSNTCERRDQIQPVAQRAMDLGIDGLMIEALRHHIDHVHNDLVARMCIMHLLADQEPTNNIATLQLAHWHDVLAERMKRARQLGLDSQNAKAIYDVNYRKSIRRQSLIMSGDCSDSCGAVGTDTLR